jgi:hypothetical protein
MPAGLSSNQLNETATDLSAKKCKDAKTEKPVELSAMPRALAGLRVSWQWDGSLVPFFFPKFPN